MFKYYLKIFYNFTGSIKNSFDEGITKIEKGGVMKNQFRIFAWRCFLWGGTLALLAGIFLACTSSQDEWRGTMKKEDGVIIVKNPKEPVRPTGWLTLREEFTIGEKVAQKNNPTQLDKGNKSESENFLFSRVSSLTVDREGRLYVVDSKEANLIVFDQNGRFLRRIGQKGQGPGEFIFPFRVILTPGELLMVEDISNRRFSFFSVDGEYKGSLNNAQEMILDPKMDSEGNIIGLKVVREESNPRYELRRYDPELSKCLNAYGSSPLPGNPSVGFNPLIALISFDLTPDDKVVFGYPEEYEIRIYGLEGQLQRKIFREYDPVKVPEKVKAEHRRKAPPNYKLIFPEYYPAYKHLVVDDKGWIFVCTWEQPREGEFYFDVFDPEGRYIARFALRTDLIVVRRGRLYSLTSNDEGFQIIKCYQILWGSE